VLLTLGDRAAAMAAAVSLAEGHSSLGVGALGVGVAGECRSSRCLGAVGGTDERDPGSGEQGTKMLAEPSPTALSTCFGVEGGSLCIDGVWTTCWRSGEVGRQARPLLTCWGVDIAVLGEMGLAAATHRAWAPESGVGTKVGSKAILLAIGGGNAPAPFMFGPALGAGVDGGVLVPWRALEPSSGVVDRL